MNKNIKSKKNIVLYLVSHDIKDDYILYFHYSFTCFI